MWRDVTWRDVQCCGLVSSTFRDGTFCMSILHGLCALNAIPVNITSTKKSNEKRQPRRRTLVPSCTVSTVSGVFIFWKTAHLPPWGHQPMYLKENIMRKWWEKEANVIELGRKRKDDEKIKLKDTTQPQGAQGKKAGQGENIGLLWAAKKYYWYFRRGGGGRGWNNFRNNISTDPWT